MATETLYPFPDNNNTSCSTTILRTKNGTQFIVPAEFADRLRPYSWHMSVKGYFVRVVTMRSRQEARDTGMPRLGAEWLHRRIMEMHLGRKLEQKPYEEIDHIDRDPSNNGLDNLRLAGVLHGFGNLNAINCGLRSDNTSGYKGIKYKKHRDRWEAYTQLQGKRIYLGSAKTPKQAAALYDDGIKKIYSEHVWLNGD